MRALVRCCRGRPAGGSVVVVGAGVDDAVRREVVRQERMRGRAAEGELQHLHAGKAAGLAQRLHVGRDDAEVLGDQRQRAQRIARGLEQRGAGGFDPAAIDGGRAGCRNLPAGGKAAKVIDPHQVGAGQFMPQPRDPPGKAVALHRLPVVQRIAPALAGGREVVGRHAGHDDRLARCIEPEQRLVCPAVGRVMGDEDRQVADQPHTARGGVLPQGLPLSLEAPLHKALELDLAGQCNAGGGQCRLVAACMTVGPLRPAGDAARGVVRIERHKECVIIEPVRVRVAERGQIGTVGGAGAQREAGAGLAQTAHAPRNHAREIHAVGAQASGLGQRAAVEPAALGQRFERDQQRRSGKGRGTRIRRVAGADRHERQHLPQILAGSG